MKFFNFLVMKLKSTLLIIQDLFDNFDRIYIYIWWYSSKMHAWSFPQNGSSVKAVAIY